LEVLEELALAIMQRGKDHKHPQYMEILKDYAEKTVMADEQLTEEDFDLLDTVRGMKAWDICIRLLALGMRKGETQAIVFMAKLLAEKIDQEIAKEKDKV